MDKEIELTFATLNPLKVMTELLRELGISKADEKIGAILLHMLREEYNVLFPEKAGEIYKLAIVYYNAVLQDNISKYPYFNQLLFIPEKELKKKWPEVRKRWDELFEPVLQKMNPVQRLLYRRYKNKLYSLPLFEVNTNKEEIIEELKRQDVNQKVRKVYDELLKLTSQP